MLLREPLEGPLELLVLLLRPSTLFLILGIDQHVRPIGILVEEGEGTHRGDVRILLRDPRGRVGVEEGAKLLEEGSELERHRNVRDAVDFLDRAADGCEVIGLPRLGTDAEVAGNIQDETHVWWRDSRGRLPGASIFRSKQFISLIHLSRNPSDAKVIKFTQFLENSDVIVGREFFFWRSISQ